VAAAVTTAARRHALPLAAAAMMALMLGLALTGKRIGLPEIGHVEGQGILAAGPSDIRRIEIRHGKERIALRRREGEGWTFDRADPVDAPGELASHLETALRFMHVATPARILDPEDYRGTELAEFGLDPPAFVVTLDVAGRPASIADFGALNPAQTSQYVRLVGQPKLYLLPRHVGAEWQLSADMAKRVAPPGSGDTVAAADRPVGMLLPASIDNIWAVEIVAAGRLHRFERDGAGRWFLHVGQHSHAGAASEHVADPVQADLIAAALGAFADTQIEAHGTRQPSIADLDRFGLARPAVIVLLYPRDSSTPLARIEVGATSEDGFGRYARLGRDGGVVTIAAHQPQRLVDLVKAVGAAP
jgi:hypothetical protein